MPDSPKILVLGRSLAGPCGVRDYANLLSSRLSELGFSVDTRWCEHDGSVRAYAQEFGWLRQSLRDAFEYHGIIIHYTLFASGIKGIPGPFAIIANLWTRSPKVVILHEVAGPWRSGLKDILWGLIHRTLQALIKRSSASFVVTTTTRFDLLINRWRIPPKRVALAYVFSAFEEYQESLTVSETSVSPPSLRYIGIFGWGRMSHGAGRALVCAESLLSKGIAVRLRLIGGRPDGDEARMWRSQARSTSSEELLEFTGALEPSEVAASLAACDAYLHLDPAGPSSDRSSLAAAFAAGLPIVAFQGAALEDMYYETDSGVSLVADWHSAELAIQKILSSEAHRIEQGLLARAKYKNNMASRLAARAVANLLSAL